MFAVVKTGGKQYRVTENQILIVEKILGEEGAAHTFDHVLLLEDGSQITVGKPLVDGAKVVASIVEQTRGDKVIIFKKKRRHTYRRKKGHRQELTVLRVQQIAKPGDSLRTLSAKPEAVTSSAAESVSPDGPAGRRGSKKTEAASSEGVKAEKKSASPSMTEKTASGKKPAATVKKTSKE